MRNLSMEQISPCSRNDISKFIPLQTAKTPQISFISKIMKSKISNKPA